MTTFSFLMLLIMVWAYFIAAIPCAYLVVAFSKKMSIYQHGSQSSGATNALRIGGWKIGVVTLFLDLIKGLFAIIPLIFLLDRFGQIAFDVFSPISPMGWEPIMISSQESILLLGIMLTPLCALLGHIYPIYTRFRGGKGVVIFVTSFFFITPFCIAVGVGAWVLSLCLLRISSVASLFLVSSSTLLSLFVSPPLITGALFMGALMVTLKHFSNIKQWLNKT